MAASLLQLLRMRPFKLGSLSVLRSPSVALFCTPAEDSAKPAKKPKTASKTAEAPDERASLLAYKTPVAFPVRFSKPGVLLAQFPSVPDQVASLTGTAEASTSDLSVANISTNNKSFELDNGSSSSSDSDSDSDSDDEKSEVKAESKSSQPDLTGSAVNKEAKFQELTLKLNYKGDAPFCLSEAIPEATPAATVATIEEVQSSMEELGVSSEVLVNSAPENCTAKDSAEAASADVLDAQTQTRANAVTEPTTSVPDDVPIETTHSTLDVASTEDEVASTEVTAENATAISATVDSAEKLVDCAPVLSEAVEEKLQAESEVKPSEEAAPVPPPEPEELFDNSTYKNYQHHSYNLYTFVDQDVEMAKFRLPQPSSGRPSPRH